jgi:histidinol-phosphate/aromatic aminotransferase/cobyric acid decarboxylase-like protein
LNFNSFDWKVFSWRRFAYRLLAVGGDSRILLDFSANINPLDPPARFIEWLKEQLSTIA